MSEERGGGGVARAILIGLVCGLLVAGFVYMGRPTAPFRGSSGAIGSLKAIVSAQALYREADKDGNGILDYGTLAQLGQATLVDSVLHSGIKQNYRFASGPGSGDPQNTWWANAIPGPELEGYGERSFFVNHEGVIYYTTTGKLAPITSLCAVPRGWVEVGK